MRGKNVELVEIEFSCERGKYCSARKVNRENPK